MQYGSLVSGKRLWIESHLPKPTVTSSLSAEAHGVWIGTKEQDPMPKDSRKGSKHHVLNGDSLTQSLAKKTLWRWESGRCRILGNC